MKILRRGMRGRQVEMLQLALIRAGYNINGANGGIDGIFGESTWNAVTAFPTEQRIKCGRHRGAGYLEKASALCYRVY